MDEALRIAREVADALAYAHGQGVIHRDIKPENILLSGGHALVADFGIARALGQAGGARLTETGMAVGTAAYMSPEQASGRAHVDGRSDIYSLGCVLYEMLAGEPPYTGPTAQAHHRQALQRPGPRGAPRAARASRSMWSRRSRGRSPGAGRPVRQRGRVRPGAAADASTRATTGSPTSRSRRPSLGAQARPAPGAGGRAGPGARRPHRPRRAVRLAAESSRRGRCRARQSCWPCCRSRTWATRPTPISPTAWPTICARSCPRSRASQVIARGSSNEYRQTTKPQQQIARELGVDYLLTATVQWEKVAGGASRVRVTPELVDVRPGHAPQTRWGQQFDAAMTDVFQVQADIAGQVAQALNVALGDSAKHELATKPTQSLPAYDAFLRGEAASQGMSVSTRRVSARRLPRTSRRWRSIRPLSRRGRSSPGRRHVLYSNSTPTPAAGEAARRAAERALALAPTRPEGHQALGDVLQLRPRRQSPRATPRTAPRSPWHPATPSCSDAVGSTNSTSAAGRRRAGTWSRRPGSIPAQRAAARQLGQLLARHPPVPRGASRPSTARSSSRPRTWTCARIGRWWRWRRAICRAQAVLQAAPKEVDPTALVAFVANYYGPYLGAGRAPSSSSCCGSRRARSTTTAATWGIVLAQTYALRGDTAKARVYADSARLAFEEQLQATPQDAQRHVVPRARAGLPGPQGGGDPGGRARRGAPADQPRCLLGPYVQHQLARIYLLVGEPEKALDQLEPLLKIPYYLSPGWLKIDPNFAPLRGNPRFERLVEGT